MVHTTPRGNGPLGGLGLACYRHRWATIACWAAGLACLVALWTQFGAAALNNFGTADPGQQLLSQHFRRQSGDTLTLAIRSAAPVTAAPVRARVARALRPFGRAAGVSAVTGPYVPGQVARDGHIAFATIGFSVPMSGISGAETAALMHDASAASGHGVTFSLGGDVVDQADTPYGGPSNGIGVGAAAIVLLAVFGSLLAMSLPVVTALFGIGTGLALIALLGHLVPAPSFSPIVASLIGLGVGVDYALFIFVRFRDGLRAGAAPPDALVATMHTAGRSVLTAGAAVAAGMLGLLTLRQALLNGVAIAAAVTVAMTVLAALTLLPALLRCTGTRLGRPSRLSERGRRRDGGEGPRYYSEGGWSRQWAAAVQRRPVTAALIGVAVLAVLAAPALGMKLSFPDESAQPRGSMGYASYATMARGFGPGFDAPLLVVQRLPGRTGALAAAVRATPGVAAVTPPVFAADGQAALLIAYPATGEQDPATSALVGRLTRVVGPRAYVTGPNAQNVAFGNVISQRLPVLIAVVVAVAMVLLTVVFRSVVVAVKAAVMNLLSVGAAYGVLVMVCQHGWLGPALGFPERMPVTTWVPVFLFVILFGLSMDYEVFLISRIREAYLSGPAAGDNRAAVALGLGNSARVISAAAAIMVVVFASFVLGADVQVKQIGLGLAAAVLVDATVVRLLLVPAVMELLGAANWWLPRPLAAILPAARPQLPVP